EHDLEAARVRHADGAADVVAVPGEGGFEGEIDPAAVEIVHAPERRDGDPGRSHLRALCKRAIERARPVPKAGVIGVLDGADGHPADAVEAGRAPPVGAWPWALGAGWRARQAHREAGGGDEAAPHAEAPSRRASVSSASVRTTTSAPARASSASV